MERGQRRNAGHGVGPSLHLADGGLLADHEAPPARFGLLVRPHSWALYGIRISLPMAERVPLGQVSQDLQSRGLGNLDKNNNTEQYVAVFFYIASLLKNYLGQTKIWLEIHATSDLEDLFLPCIRLSRNKFPISPNLLGVEITAEDYLRGGRSLHNTIRRLREIGVGVALRVRSGRSNDHAYIRFRDIDLLNLDISYNSPSVKMGSFESDVAAAFHQARVSRASLAIVGGTGSAILNLARELDVSAVDPLEGAKIYGIRRFLGFLGNSGDLLSTFQADSL